jgi:hypothetical protein
MRLVSNPFYYYHYSSLLSHKLIAETLLLLFITCYQEPLPPYLLVDFTHELLLLPIIFATKKCNMEAYGNSDEPAPSYRWAAENHELISQSADVRGEWTHEQTWENGKT